MSRRIYNPLSPVEKLAALRMRRAGYRFCEIAEQLSRPRQKVINFFDWQTKAAHKREQHYARNRAWRRRQQEATR